MSRYEQAAKGISRIYTAQILGLIAVLCTGIGSIGAAMGLAAVNGGAALIGAGLAGTFGLIALAGTILLLVSFVLSIMGLSTAAPANSNFKTALYITIAAIVLALVSGFFRDGGFMQSLSSALSSLVSVLVMFYVIKGVSELLPASELVAKGQTILKMIIVCMVVQILSGFLVLIPLIGLIAVLAGAICSVVYYVLYLMFLAQAKREL